MSGDDAGEFSIPSSSSSSSSYSEIMPAYWPRCAGPRTMVCRLEGAVEVSDSEMLSKVASLRKLDFRSKPTGCREVVAGGRLPDSAS
jgi:hypothetical protein